MRLIARKVYRAFPELDRFTDHQCDRFVRAVNRNYRGFVLRWFLVIGLSALALISTFSFSTWYLYGGNRGWFTYLRLPPLLADVIPIALPLVFAGAVALLARDIVIRLQIRRVIKTRGTCLGCGYSLLGIRVSQDRTVTCPECGSHAEADDALGELESTPEGVQVFKPVMHTETMKAREKSQRRRRTLFKVLLFLAIASVLMLAASFGGWWLFIERQAAAAKAARNLPAQVQAWQVRNRPKNVDADADNSWYELRNPLSAFNNTNAMFLSATLPQPPSFTVLYSECIDKYRDATWPHYGEKSVVEQTFQAHLQARTLDAFLPLTNRAFFERPVATSPNMPGMTWSAEVTDFYRLASLATAQVHEAATRRDGPAALSAARVAAMCIRVLDSDPGINSSWATTTARKELADVIRWNAPRFDAPGDLEALIQVLPSPTPLIPIAEQIELERLCVLDALYWFYSNPLMVRNAMVKGTQNVSGLTPGAKWQPEWIPSMQSAVDLTNQSFEILLARANDNSAASTSPSSVLQDISLLRWLVSYRVQGCGLFFSHYDEAALAVRQAKLALSIELYHRRHGDYPPNLHSLVGQGITADDLPLPGSPAQYVPWNPNDVGPPAPTLTP
jgi:hypothetical protein